LQHGWSIFGKLLIINRNYKKKCNERREKNLKEQKEFLDERKRKQENASKNPWERAMSYLDIKEAGYKGTKDIARMKSVIIERKSDFNKSDEKSK